MMSFKCDAEVLGKFFTLQTLIHAAPNDEWLGDVVCRAVADLPGACSAAFYLGNNYVAHSSSASFPVKWPGFCPESISELYFYDSVTIRRFELRTAKALHGQFFVAIIEVDRFAPYVLHVENTLSLVCLVLENKQQKQALEQLTKKLEETVEKQVRQIANHEERFRKMFLEHNAVMLLIDPETGQIVDANLAASEYYGYSRDEMISKSIQNINVMTHAEIDQVMTEAREKKKNYFVFKHRLANGETRDVESYSYPIPIDDKPLLFSIIHDITDR